MPPKIKTCRQQVNYALKKELEHVDKETQKLIREQIKRRQAELDKFRKGLKQEADQRKKGIREITKTEKKLCAKPKEQKKDVKKTIENYRKLIRGETLKYNDEEEVECEGGKCRRVKKSVGFNLQDLLPPPVAKPPSDLYMMSREAQAEGHIYKQVAATFDPTTRKEVISATNQRLDELGIPASDETTHDAILQEMIVQHGNYFYYKTKLEERLNNKRKRD